MYCLLGLALALIGLYGYLTGLFVWVCHPVCVLAPWLRLAMGLDCVT